jgi:hypothetical protein
MQFDQLKRRAFITLVGGAPLRRGRSPRGRKTREKRADRLPLFWPAGDGINE